MFVFDEWVTSIYQPPSHYLGLLMERHAFSFSRWCDGERRVLFPPSRSRANVDGCAYRLPGLAEAFRSVLEHQYPYYHACLYTPEFAQSDVRFFELCAEVCPDMPWYHADVWQSLSYRGAIRDLTAALTSRDTCIVGPSWMRPINTLMPGMTSSAFIEVPAVNAFLATDHVCAEVERMAANGYDVFGFSAGFATKVWIDRLWPVLGDRCSLIDFGSVWDPYCGHLSREESRAKGLSFFQQFTALPLQ